MHIKLMNSNNLSFWLTLVFSGIACMYGHVLNLDSSFYVTYYVTQKSAKLIKDAIYTKWKSLFILILFLKI